MIIRTVRREEPQLPPLLPASVAGLVPLDPLADPIRQSLVRDDNTSQSDSTVPVGPQFNASAKPAPMAVALEPPTRSVRQAVPRRQSTTWTLTVTAVVFALIGVVVGAATFNFTENDAPAPANAGETPSFALLTAIEVRLKHLEASLAVATQRLTAFDPAGSNQEDDNATPTDVQPTTETGSEADVEFGADDSSPSFEDIGSPNDDLELGP